MYKVLLVNKIAQIGLEKMDASKYTFSDSEQTPDAIMVRSASLHEMEFAPETLAIARAGAGVNNIPIDKCSEKGIVVFNTPGANANAVKELAISALFLTSRDIVGGVNWAQTLTGDDVAKQVEKGKSNFAGPEIMGKKLGVIGLGAIGVMFANAATYLGMEVIGFDPYISVDAAWGLSSLVKKAKSVDEIYANCDYISLHVPLNDTTRGMVGADAFNKMKKGVRLLNFSRGELVDTLALMKAIEDGMISKYATDFPNADMLGNKAIITIPHLGASTPESEDNCAKMAAIETRDYMENGNITNSVNFPNCTLERASSVRVAVLHKNIPNMLGQISGALAACSLNIAEMINKSRGDYAYTLADVEGDSADVISKISEIEGVIRVRVI